MELINWGISDSGIAIVNGLDKLLKTNNHTQDSYHNFLQSNC